MVTSLSIRKRIFNAWVENPYVTPKPLCKQLKLDYQHHGNYVKKLLSEFRSYYNYGSPQKALAHRRVFVWRNVPRTGFEPERYGWVEVANRNGMFVFRGDFGSVHWYKGGLVRLYLRGPVKLAHAKELFCHAFSWLTPEEWSRYLDVPLREESKHWVFELGSPVPRFDIRKFERSHGIRIFADKSHPTAIEVEESTPFWLGQVEESMSSFGDLHTQFGENLKAHMKLIKEWRKEARAAREKKHGFLRTLKDWIW